MNNMYDYGVLFALNQKLGVRPWQKPPTGTRRDRYRRWFAYLHGGLPLFMDRHAVEVRVPRLGAYAVVLADTEFQEVGGPTC